MSEMTEARSDAKVALVTGANKGIGFEVARQLGLQGFNVVIGARDASRGEEAASKLRELGIRASAVAIDVTRPDTVAAAADELEREFGVLDVLVNNAGIAPDQHTSPEETPRELMARTYETNVFGVVTVTNAMLPLLRKSASGRIVNQSAELGSHRLAALMEPPMVHVNWLAYNSSKAALNAVTLEYAKAFRGTPLRVNAVSPGRVSSELNGFAGGKSTAEGAAVAVHVATLADSPTGGFWNESGQIPW